MKLNNTVLTLALVGVLALAALAGGLFPAGNAVQAADPEFVDDTSSTKSVPENTPPGVNIGTPASATDGDETGTAAIEFGNTLTYELGGTDEASFDIDPSTGQLITKVPLDTETKPSYEVTVTVDDGETRTATCATCTQTVTINIANEDEPPAMPPPPTVVSGTDPDLADTNELSTTTLKVVWHPLVNTGRPVISDFDVEYKKSTDTSFTDLGHSGTATTATITGLDPDTSYQVRVRAENSDGDGPWSLVGTGSTNKKGNSPPSFSQTPPYGLSIPENSSPGQSVGVRVTADDADSRTLSYKFDGRDKDLFDFNTTTGQIRTKRGVTYDHEDPGCGYVAPANPTDPTTCTYYVTVVASDGAGGSDALRVAISVTDRTELPSAPAQPTVRPTANSRISLDVSWGKPVNTGPAITGYAVEYRLKGSSDNYTSNGVPDTVTGTSTKISGTDPNNDDAPWLTAGTSYEVRVRATSDEGTGNWSPIGTGSTNAGNREPIFRDRNTDVNAVGTPATTERELNENTPTGRPVGRPVVADDGDGDRRSYKLVAAVSPNEEDFSKFDINDSTGQILTKAPLNHEDEDCGYAPDNDAPDPPTATTCTYTVVVEVRDGLDENGNEEADETAADDTITVTITVKDVVERPSTPTVILTSPSTATVTVQGEVLGVVWFTDNTGPSIISYDLRYKQGSGEWLDDNCNTVIAPAEDSCSGLLHTNGTNSQIEGLTANTQYQVQMRARNAEGVSAWSSGSQRTNRDKADGNANTQPSFNSLTPTLELNESHERRPQDVGSVLASDGDGGTIRYSIEGPAKSLFTIDSSGLMKTRSGLDFEDPKCVPDTGNETTRCTHSVLVKIDDGQGASVSNTFTVYVLDVPEPPSAPSAPRVTATTGSGKKLDVTWSEPGNNGPSIFDYDIRYREVGGSADDWISWTHGVASDVATAADGDKTTKTTITGLDPRKTYEVEVQATNDEGTSGWSSASRGTTNASNLRPSFDARETLVTLSVDENTRGGQPVGSPVSATDNDGNRLIYTLEGPGKDSFTIVSSSGQIRTSAALDHEKRDSYSVTVKVNDGQRKDNSIATKSVTIEVSDVDEIPSVPAAPTVSGIPGSTSSVKVTWNEPANTGPDISDYDVHYGTAGTGGFTFWPHHGVDTSTIITGLTAGTRYEVQVRARNADGTSDYSRSGTGSPNPDVANRNPVFSAGSRSFSVDENTAAGDPIGDPVGATDPDDDPLSYELEGADAASFDIDRGSGQIRTSAALNHEEKSRYSVTVRARDGRGGTSTAGITISVTDVVEPPGAPLSPTVTAVSSTSLQVSWDAPVNAGPPINDYDYRYMSSTDPTWTEVTNTTIATTSVTIDGLTPSTSYDVEVRAKNAEGTSGWSSPGIGSTNAPGANNPPVFSEGASATRAVSATSPSGTLIGEPIGATDADAADTLDYSLEGRDAPSFDINETNGQLRTKSGITLIVGTTYTVVVVADDTKDTARITVSIEATAAPPNRAPVFAEGASTTRSVRDDVSTGADIGGPVRATDPDTGDTLTYSLGGTDAASFSIASTNGQIRTLAALDASRKSTYSVTVSVTDGKGGNATIAVTINISAAPTTLGCGTRGAVADRSNTGLVADCEALLKATAKLEDGARILNWSVSRPITEWDGIRGRSDALTGTPQRVTKLYLHNLGLSGTIAPELGELSELTWLYLHRNSLTGEIPGELNNLSKLERLYVYDNDLTGISSQLGSGMANLRRLFAQRNRISGSIPANLGNMPRLDFLRLDRNSLTGSLPSQLGNLDRLRRLYVHEQSGWRASGGGLTGTIPSTFGNMTRLEYLVIHRNSLSGPIPPELANLNNLIWLGMYDNGFTGQIPTELGRLSNLERLYLHRNSLSGQIPASLSGMTSLTNLWLKNNSLSGTIPFELGTLDLNRLRISGNAGLTGCVPAGLVPTRSITDSAGRVTAPSHDIAESGLLVCN